jgi:hypothetical protein
MNLDLCIEWPVTNHLSHGITMYMFSQFPKENMTLLCYEDHLVMLLTEIITTYSGTHTKPINILCGQKAELMIVIARGTSSYHWALKIQNTGLQ